MIKQRWPIAFVFILGTSAAPRPPSEDKPLPSAPTSTQQPLAMSQPPVPAPMQHAGKENEIHELFAEGHYEECLALIKSEWQKAPQGAYKDWLKAQIPTVLTSMAFRHLAKQNCTDALPILESIAAEDRPKEAWKALGYCYQLKKDWQSAITSLSTYRLAAPADVEGLTMLAKSLEANGQIDEAIDLIESAEALPEAEPLPDTKLKSDLAIKQQERLQQARLDGGLFHIQYPRELGSEFAERALTTLQEAATDFNQELGLDYPSHALDVIFYKEDAFDLSKSGPEWSRGLYDGRIQLPVGARWSWNESSKRSLRHEFMHAMIAESVQNRNLPTWFQEGFAQLGECAGMCRSYEFAATTQGFMSLDALESSFLQLNARQAHVAYKQSLFLVITLIKTRSDADIKQMFSTMGTLEDLTSQNLVSLAGADASSLWETARRRWQSGQSY